jgi:hypothetical protein
MLGTGFELAIVFLGKSKNLMGFYMEFFWNPQMS